MTTWRRSDGVPRARNPRRGTPLRGDVAAGEVAEGQGGEDGGVDQRLDDAAEQVAGVDRCLQQVGPGELVRRREPVADRAELLDLVEDREDEHREDGAADGGQWRVGDRG